MAHIDLLQGMFERLVDGVMAILPDYEGSILRSP
jgi:hypothetical protein